MNLTVRMLLTFTVITVLILWFASNQFDSLPEGTKAELPAQLKTVDGEVIESSSFKGRPLVINFWATWCPPCLVELPGFVNAALRFAGEVSFIGLAVDSPLQEIQRFRKKLKINFPVVLASTSLISAYKADQLPTTYLIDQNGEVAWSHLGYASESELVGAISDVLEKKKIQAN